MRFNLYASAINNSESYARHGLSLARACVREGATVLPVTNEMMAWPPELKRMVGLNFDDLTISLMPGYYISKLPGRQWAYTMYEDTSIPDGWAQRINTYCERLLVPCEHNAKVFADKGVIIPIHVVHEGIEPDEFPLLPSPSSDTYTFICDGNRGPRKGAEIALTAFCMAFPEKSTRENEVSFIIKTRDGGWSGIVFDDPRITLWDEDIDTPADIYARADCFVFPSKGEGWGQPPREAAAMGLPAIATNWSGLEVGIEHWGIPINKYYMQRSLMDTRDGYWAIPDLEETAYHMRWCYEHREKAREHGLAAAKWLRENQTWKQAAQQLIALVERYG